MSPWPNLTFLIAKLIGVPLASSIIHTRPRRPENVWSVQNMQSVMVEWSSPGAGTCTRLQLDVHIANVCENFSIWLLYWTNFTVAPHSGCFFSSPKKSVQTIGCTTVCFPCVPNVALVFLLRMDLECWSLVRVNRACLLPRTNGNTKGGELVCEPKTYY